MGTEIKIYKYFSFDTDNLANDKKLDSLKNNYLWFSKPRFFNDPFDCNMQILSYYDKFLSTIKDRFQDNVVNNIISGTSNFGICCFSETNDNEHMWAQYTNCHKGICVEYQYTEEDFDDYFSETLQCKCDLQKVDYRDNLIDLNGKIEWEEKVPCTQYETIDTIFSLRLDFKKIDRLFEKLLLQKKKQIWQNEQERRLIILGKAREHIQQKKAKNCEELDTGYKIPIKKELIKSITFGVNAPENLKKEIENIFEDNVQYKNVVLDFENWKIKIISTVAGV
jgi:hypothetical protein